MQSNIRLRHNVVKLMRRYLEDEHNFVEVLYYLFFIALSVFIFITFGTNSLTLTTKTDFLSFCCSYVVIQGRLRLQYYLDPHQKGHVTILYHHEFRYFSSYFL
jgi:hypothetical protein